MNRSQILKLAGMPAQAPSYPRGPYRFVNREYFIVTYESDADAIRAAVPEPLVPEGNIVNYEFIKMPDSSGFGDYQESGVVIPCTFKGKPVNFTALMFLDNEPPLTGGREIWGFPKKYGNPDLTVMHDTLTGTLKYDDILVAVGTMQYKPDNLLAADPAHVKMRDPGAIKKKLGKTQVNLKLIPGVDGKPEIAQLVAYNMNQSTLKGAWAGHARLHLVPHVNAPVADFPVKKVVGGSHFIADITLPYGRVIHDYLA